MSAIESDRDRAIRGMDYWAKNAGNPAIRVDCAHARDILRRQGPITDAQVEAASQAFGGLNSTDWASTGEWEREEVRRSMRAALEAARKVTDG